MTPLLTRLNVSVTAATKAPVVAQQLQWSRHYWSQRISSTSCSSSSAAAAPHGSTVTSPGSYCSAALVPPGPTLTLERAIGGTFGSDEQLRQSGAFAAEVFPDLPIATTWGNLMKAVLPRPASHSETRRSADPVEVASNATVKVKTVAVNLRSMQDVRQRILAATAETSVSHQRAGALLFVSGSHPVRGLPGVRRFLPSSVDALKLASELRERGDLPRGTELWAVANPNLEPDASLLEAKANAGAQVILTQPPFDQAAFQTWMGDAARLGLATQMRIVVGMPCISSSGNLAFWLNLAGCVGNPAAMKLLATFQAAGRGGDKEAFAAYCMQYNTDLFKSLLAMPRVAGLHVMPISPASRRIALQLVSGLAAQTGGNDFSVK